MSHTLRELAETQVSHLEVVSKFSLCGSIDGKSWIVLATYDANPPTQDYAVLLNNVTLDLTGDVLNLQMFMKSY